MTETITRHCINPAMVLYSHQSGQVIKTYNYNDFCLRIDRWKSFFIELYNAAPGQRILFDFTIINVDYFAAIFAAAELGLVLVTELPGNLKNFFINETPAINYSQQKIDYILQFGANTEWNQQRNEILGKHIITPEYWADYQIKDREKLKTHAVADSLLTTTLDGHNNTHREIYIISQRLQKLLGYQNDRILHTTAIQLKDNNLYWNLLAGFMGCQEHFIFNPVDCQDRNNYSAELAEFVVDNKINHVPLTVFLPNVALHYIRATKVVDYPVQLTTVGAVNKETLRLSKEKNINSIRCIFGQQLSDTGLFIKTFTSEYDVEQYQLTNVGAPLDDFYQFEIRNNELYVACPELAQEYQATGYQFAVRNGEYHFYGAI